MCNIVRSKDGAELMDVGKHMREARRQSCTATWMTVQGLWDIGATSKGSKPGDSLGDLLFSLVALRFLQAVECDLQAADA
eukprot:8108833-Lingulodinium_polyedra.AAC.1